MFAKMDPSLKACFISGFASFIEGKNQAWHLIKGKKAALWIRKYLFRLSIPPENKAMQVI
jgi:hypothetical protein